MAEKVIILPEAFTASENYNVDNIDDISTELSPGIYSCIGSTGINILMVYIIPKSLSGGEDLILQEIHTMYPPGIIKCRMGSNSLNFTSWVSVGNK